MVSGTFLIPPWSEMSATRPEGASCCTAMADPLPGQFTNRSGALPPPSWARSAVCSWSVGENDALIVTSGATVLYLASNSSQAGLASVMAVSVSVTLPPELGLSSLVSPCVPDPHAEAVAVTAARQTTTATPRMRRLAFNDRLFIDALLRRAALRCGPTDDRVATRGALRALENP